MLNKYYFTSKMHFMMNTLCDLGCCCLSVSIGTARYKFQIVIFMFTFGVIDVFWALFFN